MRDDTSQKRLLIADDSPTMLDILEFTFASADFDVVTAADGVEAVVKAYQAVPDLIMMDLEMPRMNGYQACRLLKEDPRTRHIPIIIQTSLDKEKDKFWGYATGADGYIVKGAEPEEMVAEVLALLDRSAPEANPNPSTRTVTEAELFVTLNRLLDRKLFQSTIVNRLAELSSRLTHFDDILLQTLKLLRKAIAYDVGMLYLDAFARPSVYTDRVAAVTPAYDDEARARFTQALTEKGLPVRHDGFFVEVSGCEPLAAEGSARLDCFITFPLLVRGKALGVIGLGGASDVGSEESAAMLKVFSEAAAIVLDSAVLYRTLNDSFLQLQGMEAEIRQKNLELEAYNELIKNVFGRYQTVEVVETLLKSSSGLELGGERRRITIMFTDLRGFTAVSEAHAPEVVVGMLNRYFDHMIDICARHHGVVNEIVGDGMVIFFGAPVPMADHACRAVACAVDMQRAMVAVNEEFRRRDLPELNMGIGINTGDVVVGNIGSEKRAKYAAIGSHVNLASRIESYTTGGQILASSSVVEEVGEIVRVNRRQEVELKGVRTPLTLYDIGGIGGAYDVFLPASCQTALEKLAGALPFQYDIVVEKHIEGAAQAGVLLGLSLDSAEVRLHAGLAELTNVRILLSASCVVDEALYAKIVNAPAGDGDVYRIRFSHLPPKVADYFKTLLDA